MMPKGQGVQDVPVFDDLSVTQRSCFIDVARDLFVLACPGSGKTRGLSARATLKMATGERIACLSYTNNAVAEMRQASSVRMGQLNLVDNYFGTVHSFLLKFVIRPFGMAYLHSDSRIEVSNGRSASPLSFRGQNARGVFTFHVNPDDCALEEPLLRITRHPEGCFYKKEQLARVVQEDGRVCAVKEQAMREGRVSTDDVAYYASRILAHGYPARALASRFDEILIDEVQDLTPTQIKCLQFLRDANPRLSVVLVGDLDQTIFGFAGVEYGQILEFSLRHRLIQRKLLENYRSSQRICDTFSILRATGDRDTAVGRFKNEQARPAVIICPDEGSVFDTINGFARRMETEGIGIEQCFALAERHEVLNAYGFSSRGSLGFHEQWRTLKVFENDLAMGVGWNLLELSRADALRFRRISITLFELGLGGSNGEKLSLGAPELVPLSDDLQALGLSAGELLQALPAPRRMRTNASYHLNQSGLRGLTVHQAKGATAEGVLILGGRGYRAPDAARWASVCAGKIGLDDPDARILYVALSRAARHLWLVVLARDADAGVIQSFVRAGFDVLERANFGEGSGRLT